MPPITRRRAFIAREQARAQHFRLLDLPPELWLRIGEFAVTFAEPQCINHRKPSSEIAEWIVSDFSPPVRMLQQPAICRVNRLLRKELLPLYFRNNDFHGSNSREGFVLWLQEIGREARAHMGRVFVSSTGLYSSPRSMITFVWASDDWDPRDEIDGVEEATAEEKSPRLCCADKQYTPCYRVSFKSMKR